MSMTEANIKGGLIIVSNPEGLTISILLLKRVLYIQYSMQFKKYQVKIQALLDSNSEVNAITPAYMARLDLKVQLIDIEAQKIDNSIFEIFEIVLASF